MSYKNRESVSEKLRLSFEDVKKMYLDNNCVLLSEEAEYKNISSKLKFRCSCGNEESKTIRSFRYNKPMCCECVRENVRYIQSIKAGNDLESIQEICDKNNIKLLTIKKYYHPTDIIDYICSCGNIASRSIKYFKINNLCNDCKLTKEAKETYFEVKKYIENTGCKLLTSYQDYQDKKSLIKILCTCGDIFETRFILFKFENKIQCTKCGIKLRSGKNAPRWKGGITTENEKIRKSEEYKNWRISVFERDNFICQCCNDDTGGNLQAHHIENFINNEDLRFSIDNGITMCENCHNPSIMGSFHNIYGTFNNNVEQLNEYINLKQLESQKDSLLLCSNE